MMDHRHEKSVALALVIGILTVIFCLIIADGILGINGLKVDHGVRFRVKTGAIVFWVFIVGLPLVVMKWVRWLHTLPNLLLYFVMYFPVYYYFGSSGGHAFLEPDVLLPLPVWAYALFTAVAFWGIQSMVLCMCDIIRFLWKKCKKA